MPNQKRHFAGNGSGIVAGECCAGSVVLNRRRRHGRMYRGRLFPGAQILQDLVERIGNGSSGSMQSRNGNRGKTAKKKTVPHFTMSGKN